MSLLVAVVTSFKIVWGNVATYKDLCQYVSFFYIKKGNLKYVVAVHFKFKKGTNCNKSSSETNYIT